MDSSHRRRPLIILVALAWTYSIMLIIATISSFVHICEYCETSFPGFPFGIVLYAAIYFVSLAIAYSLKYLARHTS
jgi:hypothetical protein